MADENWAKLVDEQEGGGLSRQITNLSLNGDKEKASEDGDCKKSSPPAIIIPPAEPKISFGGGDTKEDDEKSPTLAEASYLRKILGNKLLNSKNDVEILRKDPNSPLYAVKSFEELNLWPELLKGVYALGFNYPSKIQETALPTLLADPPQNMIAQSQSGTGKTAAFVLAMLSRVNPQNHWPQVLCLSPTYELTLQTGHVVKQMGQYCREVTVCLAVRGEEIKKNQKIQDHIIIGTPGKVLDWATKFNAFDAKKINVFVLDEADVMIDTQGHRDQSIRIHKLLRRDCQMLLFSATYDQEIIEFAEAIVHDPVTIRLRREEESLDNIKQFYIECKNAEEKFQALVNIYGGITIGQAMIFCQTRKTASWLSEKMTKDGHAVGLLSGELTVEQRVDILNRFRQGKEKVLITTNVSARGIDVEQVTVVVNFDIPMDMKRKADCETYLHRIGRTGRFGKAGLAINMVDGQHSKNLLKQIEDHFGRKIVKLDAEDIDELEKIAA